MNSALREIHQVPVDYNGLSEREAEKRLLEYGHNELMERKKRQLYLYFFPV